jgi:hypothetical protein
LVTLDAADLANEEIERLRKEREHQAIVSKIKTEEDFLVTGRNKFDTFVAAEPGVNSEREMQSKLEESTFEGDAPSPATLGLVEHASGSSLPPHERFAAFVAQERSSSNLPGSSNADETNLDLPAESAPEEPMEQVPVIEINIGDIGFDATAAQSAPEIPPPTEEPKPDSVWTGTIKYEGFNDLKVRAYHVNGDAIPPALWPAAWNITSRASLPDTLRYLPKIDVSNSRKRTIVIYEPYGEQDIETYEVRKRLPVGAPERQLMKPSTRKQSLIGKTWDVLLLYSPRRFTFQTEQLKAKPVLFSRRSTFFLCYKTTKYLSLCAKSTTLRARIDLLEYF